MGRRFRSSAKSTLLICASICVSAPAWADDPAKAAPNADETAAPPITADQAKAALEGGDKTESLLPQAPLEAPPPPPHKTGLVLEGSLGALGFAGKFGKIAHPAYWAHMQLGYEIFRFLMPFIEGELAYTDTSLAADASKNRAFSIFGFGGGLRFTIHATPRFGIFIQGDVGAMEANITKYALTNLGYGNAEKLGLYAGGRIGFEYYQVDRHMALALAGGVRDVTNFARTIGSDLPLAWDAEATIRYTF